MPLQIARSTEAVELLRNPGFRSQWFRLYRECPWATAAQSPAFVSSWYEAYKEAYSPVLVSEFSASNALIGFLPLALCPSGQAVLPGAHQAEYQAWLALESNGTSFLEASLRLLSQETQIGALSFKYLPSGAPINNPGVLPRLPWICELEPHSRPIIRLAGAADVAEYVRQKTNKTIRNSWARLRRVGDVQLQQIRDSQELAIIFDRLIGWYEVRQEKAHGKRPFQADRNKKTWHLSLLKEGLLHVTLLKGGPEIVSALFGLSDGRTYSVMMSMFAPDYARYSPVALHHLALVENLHADGYSVLDLTPGPDPFKQRFAGAYETVNVLSVYFKQAEWIKAKLRRQGEAITRDVLAALGMNPSSAGRALQRIRAFLKWNGPSGPQPTAMHEPAPLTRGRNQCG